MGTPILPVPAKNCETCGTPMERKRYNGRLEDRAVYMRRRHCSLSCANSRQEVTKDAHHWRARLHKADSCEVCGPTERLHVHHKDRNHENNDPANLATLCASCHLKLHWREDRDVRMAAAKRAAATAKSRGATTRQRSADGKSSQGDRHPTRQSRDRKVTPA